VNLRQRKQTHAVDSRPITFFSKLETRRRQICSSAPRPSQDIEEHLGCHSL
jgi:hypothetical protein